jgi:aminoglycoside 6'-N-acetyltransferase
VTSERQVIVSDGDVSIAAMRDDPADYRLLARWLTDERVLEYYGGRDAPRPHERVVERYGPRARGEDPVRPCIISYRGEEIGYVQYYPVTDPSEYGLDDTSDTYAADIFIGEPRYWDRGIGTGALSALARHIFETLGARRIVIDPHVDNLRAIRSYEKAGFVKAKVLPAHEMHEGERRDAWLMTMERSEEREVS